MNLCTVFVKGLRATLSLHHICVSSGAHYTLQIIGYKSSFRFQGRWNLWQTKGSYLI